MTDIFTREMTKEKNLEALRRLQELEKKRVPKDMTAIHKKFEEKKQEEIKRVEERFEALLKQGDVEFVKEEKPEVHQQEEENND